MAKSSKRRELDRAKREISAAQKRVATQRRQAGGQLFEAIIDKIKTALDPATPPEGAADVIAEMYIGNPVDIWLVPRMLAVGQPIERLTAVAEILLAELSVTGLTFAAAVASAAQDKAKCRQLLDEALEQNCRDQTRLAAHLHAAGRVAEAIEILEQQLHDNPAHIPAPGYYGAAIEAAFKRIHGSPPDEQGCPCGRGSSWAECCAQRERAALGRYSDRSGLETLREEVSLWLAASEYAVAAKAWMDRALPLDGERWKAADSDGVINLLSERAWLTVALDPVVGDVDDQDDPDDAPLTAFIDDPGTSDECARRATDWKAHAHYGLWRLDFTEASPGIPCTDLISGITRYVDFPAGTARPRWSVWLGAVVPVDGLWRCTGAGVWLSPDEGDAAMEMVIRSVNLYIDQVAGKKSYGPTDRRPVGVGHAPPRGVLVDYEEPPPPSFSGLIYLVTCEAIPHIANSLLSVRTSSPGVVNTDEDKMCLVSARIAVSDCQRAASRLASRMDFEPDEDEPGSLTWYGLGISEDETQALLAKAAGQPLADEPEDDEEDQPRRWERGTLRFEGDCIVTNLNSAEQLARLLKILDQIGANPSVVRDKRAHILLPAKLSDPIPVAEGWEKVWLVAPDMKLDGRSPKEAANGDRWSWIEARLRQLEYEADLLAAEGREGVDTAWLRQELDLDPSLPSRRPALAFAYDS